MKKIFLGLLFIFLSQPLQARYYDPDMGRFASRDPIGYSDGMNLYAGYFAQEFQLDPMGTEMKKTLVNSKAVLDGITKLAKQHKLPTGIIGSLDTSKFDVYKHSKTSFFDPVYGKPDIMLEHRYFNGGDLIDFNKDRRTMSHLQALFEDYGNESFHAFYHTKFNEEECKWIKEIFDHLAKDQWGNVEMGEEAASELADTVMGSIFQNSFARKPKPLDYPSTRKSPAHNQPGEKWHGNEEATYSMRKPFWKIVIYLMKYGCDPCVGKSRKDKTFAENYLYILKHIGDKPFSGKTKK